MPHRMTIRSSKGGDLTPFIAWPLMFGLLLPSLAGANDPPFIEVDPQSTTALRARGTNQPFVAVGVNYFPPNVGWAPKLWRQFDENQVRQHLQMLHQHGFNTIRVFLTYDAFHAQPGQVHPAGEAKFRRLIALRRELKLYLIPSGPDHWEGVPDWRKNLDRFANETILSADEAWWRSFAQRFKNEPTILAWDLHNEPAIGWNSPSMKAKWNAWLKNRYHSTDQIETAWSRPREQIGTLGEIDAPPDTPAANDQRLYDYQRFRQSLADHWTKRLTRAIRAVDPQHLITIGHIQWTAPVFLPNPRIYAGFDLQANAQYVDFTTIHFYPLSVPRPDAGPQGIANNAQYLKALLRACSVGKPIMLGEFAWYGGGDIRAGDKVVLPIQTPADQAAWGRQLLETSRGRVCGWLHWAFADTPTSNDLTRWSGLWTEDLQLKPWGSAFVQFAQAITTTPAKPRPLPPYPTTDQFDPRELLTNPNPANSFHQLAD